MARRPPIIQAYAGHRNGQRVRLTARVFRRAPAPPHRDGWRARLAALWSTWVTHEWPGAGVAIAGEGWRGEARTDREGYVAFDLACDRPLPDRTSWERVRLWLPDHPDVPLVEAQVLVPGCRGRLGVISDMDDTVIVTGRVGLRNWRRLLLQPPAEREVVPGAKALLDALSEAGSGCRPEGDPAKEIDGGRWERLTGTRREPATRARGPTAVERPLFYVSSSPWNLYAYLTRFLALNGLPAGVFALRDWGLNRATFDRLSHGSHKGERIGEILAFHPELRFVLVGDDSQGDVVAYAQAVTAFPDRVAAVFLRSTAVDSLSAEEAGAIATMRAAGLPVYVGPVWDAGVAMVEALGLDPEGTVAEDVAAEIVTAPPSASRSS